MCSVNDDDFESDVKREAAQYKAQKRNAADRESVKETSKRRRHDQLKPLKLPPGTARRDRTSKTPDADEDGLDDSIIGRKRKGKRRQRDPLPEGDDLEFEGRKRTLCRAKAYSHQFGGDPPI